MTTDYNVQKDLYKLFGLIILIGAILVALTMYDARTNDIGKFGEILFKKYIK